MPDDATSSDPVRVASAEVADPRSAMTPRFNFFFRWFAKRYFRHFDLDDPTVQRLRELESRGSVFYVMRYASRLDYFLFNTLFARESVRLSAFANGLSFYYYQPLLAAIRVWFQRRRMSRKARREFDVEHARQKVREVALAGESAFLFLRTARRSRRIRGRRAAVEQGRRELDLLGEIVDSVWTENRPVHLVPLALFWRKGPRAERRFLNLAYGAPTRPSDFAKVSSFLVTYRGPLDQGGGSDRSGCVRRRSSPGGKARHRTQGAAFDPALPLPGGAERRGADPALPPQGPGDGAGRSPGAGGHRGALASAQVEPRGGARRSREDLPRDLGQHELHLPGDAERRRSPSSSRGCSSPSRPPDWRRWRTTRSGIRWCWCRVTAPTSTS